MLLHVYPYIKIHIEVSRMVQFAWTPAGAFQTFYNCVCVNTFFVSYKASLACCLFDMVIIFTPVCS